MDLFKMSNIINQNEPQNNFCSCEIEFVSKGFARPKVRIIRTDLDTEALKNDIVNLYLGVLKKLEDNDVKLEPYRNERVIEGLDNIEQGASTETT